MLRLLKIQNLAIVDEVEVEFGQGFNVLTGETGAGKSILIGALDIAVGGRTNADIVRSGESEARIDTLFEIPDDLSLSDSLDLHAHVHGELVLSRCINPAGKSKCLINETLVSSASLKAIGRKLVSIFGQHEHLALTNPGEHLDMVDRFGGLWDRRNGVAEAYADWKSAEKMLLRCDQDLASRQKEAQDNTEIVAELTEANIRRGEDEALRREREKLSKSVQIREKAYEAYNSLYGRSSSITAGLTEARKILEYLGSLDTELIALKESLSDVIYRLEDVAFELRGVSERTQSDPGRLELIEDRLNLLRRLEKKHNKDLDGLIELREALEEESDKLEEIAYHRRTAEAAANDSRTKYFQLAGELSEARKEAADKLGSSVERELRDLAMPHCQFKVMLKPLDSKGPAITGTDSAEFLLAANPGEPFKSLARIASGGELSRVMLALKALELDRRGSPTVIFDEVDAGIGGHTASAVGSRLARVAKKQQVLCVTHLHQIAALADQHLSVKKLVKNGRTQISVELLNREGRIQEIARMIGASPESSEVRSHITNLIDTGEMGSGLDS
jgi:DNA repair protein RecN (Recombination protein N)